MRAAAAILAACALTACGTAPVPAPPGLSPAATPNPSPTFPAAWALPDNHLTPGAIGTTDIGKLCPHVDRALEGARPTTAEKARVYQAYGIPYPQPAGAYELDHLIPIALGGAPGDPANEWPQKNDAPDPAMIAKWHLSPAFIHNSKDLAEDVGHRLLCDNRLSLTVAQQVMATDWRHAYEAWVVNSSP